MLWCAMCRMVYVYATLSSLALSSQPVCVWVGWHRCLTVCTYAHIVQTIVSHLSSLSLLLLYILYNIYTTTIHNTKYDICLHYTVSCEEAMLYTNSCIYYTMPYYMYICDTHCDIWLWIIILYTTLIYYTITIIITIILIYFLFLLLCCCMCVRVCVCVVLCCLSCVCMCALLCILAYAHTCVSVCVYPGSPSQTVLWWRG